MQRSCLLALHLPLIHLFCLKKKKHFQLSSDMWGLKDGKDEEKRDGEGKQAMNRKGKREDLKWLSRWMKRSAESKNYGSVHFPTCLSVSQLPEQLVLALKHNWTGSLVDAQNCLTTHSRNKKHHTSLKTGTLGIFCPKRSCWNLGV